MSTLTNILEWTEADKNTILEKFGRTQKTAAQDVESVKIWMGKQPHLPEITGDEVILAFLVLNKFRIEKVKKKLDMYYTVRTLIPEFYDANPNDPKMQKVMDASYALPLPKLTKNLNRVVLHKFKNGYDHDPAAYFANILNFAEIRLRHDCSSEEICIYDMAGIKFSNLALASPSLIKKELFVVEKVYSYRPQSMNFINVPGFMDSFISLLKSLMSEKLSQRVHVHKTMESLYKVVPKNILPADYGGDERTLDELTNLWKKTFLEHAQLFKHLSGLKVDESLRINRKEYDSLELQGNFRKLAVD